jgi:hypothetical protein
MSMICSSENGQGQKMQLPTCAVFCTRICRVLDNPTLTSLLGGPFSYKLNIVLMEYFCWRWRIKTNFTLLKLAQLDYQLFDINNFV